MVNSITADPIRQLLEEWDREHTPSAPFHPDSQEWAEALREREAVAASAAAWAEPLEERWEGPTDLEWLEYEAFRYRSIGSDVARLAADALADVARRMADSGHFDAGGYRDHLARESQLDEIRSKAYQAA